MRKPVANASRAASAARSRLTLRGFWVAVHRYVGLAIATFLLVAALTGSMLAFYKELDAALNPALMLAEPPTPDARAMEPLALRARVLEQVPGISVETLELGFEPGYSITYWQQVGEEEWRSVHVDPYTGSVLGFRSGASLANGIGDLMPFIYRLHQELALGETGHLLLGIVSLLWTIDCFVGLYLTFPLRGGKQVPGRPRASWLSRWKSAWLIKTGKLFSKIFTFHRASGLWMWPLLLVFAWSSVGFNMGSVYYPAMSVLGTAPDVHAVLPQLETPRTDPKLDWPEALATARRLMDKEAEERGFVVHREGWLGYESDHGIYQYRVHSSADVGSRYPGARIWFDSETAHVYGFYAPTGMATGETISGWLFALHMASVGGVPYRIFVLLLGLAVAALCITGIWIWVRKRRPGTR